MTGKKIVVVGSSNTDMVVQAHKLPSPGETVLGKQFTMNPGGKGANQAVAAAKLGGDVAFLARVGNDMFGKQAIEGFKAHNIDVSAVRLDEEHPSGVALITVDNSGENCIAVALGANGAMSNDDIDQARAVIEKSAIVLVQLEIPLTVVDHLVGTANALGVPVVLNPAPAQELPQGLLSKVAIITPNETEAELLTGIEVSDEASAEKAALKLQEAGVQTVIITMGSQGVYLHSANDRQMVPCPTVEVVDTTAAGDTFNGALVVGLTEGLPMLEAIEFANKAAAFSVTKLGAQSSAPSRQDIINL